MSQRLPEGLRHIAVIMDGNGRWAGKKLKSRIFGHNKGSETVSTITRYCAGTGLEVLSLFAFSTENWERPAKEVDALMDLFLRFLKKETVTVMENNIRFVVTGETGRLPEAVRCEIAELTRGSALNTGMVLNLCVSYGGRQEIVDTARKMCNYVIEGGMSVDDITVEAFNNNLWTAGLPDPDLLVRTSGEFRISNFLLWQLAYSEIYITDVLWPDFSVDDMKKAIESYSGRKRRYGKI
ncbi:MAG: isoprenyl transferase [Oligoflexia bacterium]|nr:isoprenyl transferase [Oligoflexia bacterium]